MAALVSDSTDPLCLRSEALNSLRIAAGYFTDKTLKAVQTYPWKLGLGPPHEAIAELAALSEEPEDLCAGKLYRLLQAGAPHNSLYSVCELLQQAPWSSLLVEQAHGSASVVQRLHPTLGLEQHLARSYLHQCRHLFTRGTGLPTQQDAPSALDTQHTQRRITARNAMFRRLVSETRAQHGGNRLSKDTMQFLMGQHAAMFATLSTQEVQDFEQQALVLNQQRQEQQQAELRHLAATAHLTSQRHEEELRHSGGVSNASSWCKLTQEQARSLACLFEDSTYSGSQLKELRSRACDAPQAPPDSVQAFFNSVQDTLPKKVKVAPPLWVKVLCEHREHFQGLCIGPSFDAGEVVYKFLHAVQNPRLVVFQSLKVVSPVMPTLDHDIAEVVESHATCEMEILLGEYKTHAELPFEDDQVIIAISDVTYHSALRLRTFAQPTSLDTLLSWYPHKHRHSEREPTQKKSKAKSEIPEEQLHAHPWLEQFLSRSGSHMTSGHKSAKTSASSHQDPRTLDLDEEQVAAAWGEFRETRDAWAQSLASSSEDFKVSLRGGAWTRQHRGVAADAVMASAATELGRRWTAQYSCQRMASFSILLDATLMAMEWCRRRQHYCDIWKAQGAADYAYTDDDHFAYKPPTDWTDLMQKLTAAHACHQRAQALDSFRPQCQAP